MKRTDFDSLFAVLEEMGRALTRAMRTSLRAIATMPWPTLLVACILLAMVISILPLVLFLFVVFMAIKLVAASIVQHKRRGPATPHRPAATESK